MIRRDSRNIGKTVRINIPGTVVHNRIGKVKAFRGNHSKGNPFVVVFVYNLHNKGGGSYTFPGNRLEVVKPK